MKWTLFQEFFNSTDNSYKCTIMKLSSYIEILFWLSIKYFEETSYECSKSFIWQDDISYAQTVYPKLTFS